jgi:hypothetical protein
MRHDSCDRFDRRLRKSVSDNLYHAPMAYGRIATEHAGPKNGGGAWMMRAEAKQAAKRKRRQADKKATVRAELPNDAGTIAS